MNILIAGAGKVGKTIANELSDEGHDITIIDSNSKVLEEAISKYDVIGVVGNSASKDVLEEANVQNMDIFIAATSADEVNLLSTITAHSLNENIHTIARIRNPEYAKQAYDMRDVFSLSLVVNPEKQTAMEIARLLKYPGFLKRETFAKARVEIVELKVLEDSILNNVKLMHLQNTVNARVLVCAVTRNGESYIPDGNFVLEKGDRIYVTGETQQLHTMLTNIGIITMPVKHAIITGGGKITYYLAEELHRSNIATSIIEYDEELCETLASKLPFATVIRGDVSDRAVLDGEEIDGYDAFVSLTGMDELNIVTSLYAHTNGVPQVVTKLGRGEAPDLIGNMPIGSVVCPKELCTMHIVRYVRAIQNSKGAALTIHRIAEGNVEAIEFEVDKDTKHINEPLKNTKTKDNVLIVSIRHGTKVSIGGGDATYDVGDSVIVVAQKNAAIHTLNDIFEE